MKENPASRLNDYFRDELSSEKDPDSCYYLYERSALLYGLFIEGSWQFGLKVKSEMNVAPRYALLSAYTIYTVNTVYTVYTIETDYTAETVACMPI